VPPQLRGVPVLGMMHIADWYATFGTMARLANPTEDPIAQAAGLPAVDSLDMSSMLLTQSNASTRSSIILSPNALIKGDLKLLVGIQYGATWSGPLYPNATTLIPGRDVYSATLFCKPGCLYNVTGDPEERIDLAATQPDLLQEMLQELAKQAKTIWYRARTRADPQCMQAAKDLYSGFLGPWIL